MKNILWHKIILSMLLLFPARLFAGSAGSTGMNFLKIEAGAKALGSGGAFSAVADDASAPYWNPAGLSRLRSRQVSLMHLSWFEGINYQFASYAHPIKNHGTAGLSLYYLSSGDVEAYDNYGARLQNTVKASDLAAVLSYGAKFYGVDCGMNIKYLSENLAGESAVAYAADLGFIYGLKTGLNNAAGWIGNELKLALAAQNLGTQVKFVKEEYPLPSNYKLGLAQNFLYDTLTFSLDANMPADAALSLNAGLDYKLTDWISLRAGYRYKSQTAQYDIEPGLVGGIGLGNEYISVDYAFAPYGILGNTHRIGINYRFGRDHEKALVDSNLSARLAKAVRYYQKKDLISANIEANYVLSVDPLNEEAKTISALIRSGISSVKVDKYFTLLEAYINDARLSEAKELYDSMVQLFPADASVAAYAPKLDAALGRQKSLRAESIFRQGQDFFRQGQYHDAISLWEKLLLMDPAHKPARENIELAKAELEKLAEKKKREELAELTKLSDAAYKKGQELYKKGIWEAAVAQFEYSLKLIPGRAEAEKFLKETRKMMAQEYADRGMKSYQGKDYNSAVKFLAEAAKLDPGNSSISESLNKARIEYEAMRKTEAETFNREGLKAYESGNLQDAIRNWQKASDLDPENEKINNNLNRAREELKNRK